MPVLAADLPTASVIAAIAVLAVVAALAVWQIPIRQRRRWERDGVAGKDLAELENSARSTLAQLLGGVALILTFVATWLQISDAKDASKQALNATLAQQRTERFTRAVEQLGSSKREVRVGGIYGLEQAARDDSDRRAAVAQLMLTFLRSDHGLRHDPRPNEILSHLHSMASLCASSAAPALPDTQAALTVLLAIPREARPPLDLSGADLTGVRLNGADLRGAILRDAKLPFAKLENARLDHARIPAGTDLRGACLRGAHLDGAIITLVEGQEGADFTGADLSRATLAPGALYGAIADICQPGRKHRPASCKRP